MSELVSIIVPVYNVEQYLEECIESILRQTYTNIEIILVNDGSTDRSAEICKKAAESDSRVVVREKENGGLASARNFGLDCAKGQFISFVDSDDTIEATMIEQMYNQFKSHTDTDLVVCGFVRYDDESGRVFSREMMNLTWNEISGFEDANIVYLNPAVWNKMYSKSFFDDVRFEKVRLSEDLVLMLDILKKVRKIRRVPECLYNYRVRSTSLINSVNMTQVKPLYKQIIDRRRLIKSDDVEYASLFDAIVFLHIGVSLTFRLIEGDRKQEKKYIKDTKKLLDKEFIYWKKTPYLSFGLGMKNGFKGIGLWGCKILYQLNLFGIFVKFYEFIHTRLKIDIKW